MKSPSAFDFTSPQRFANYMGNRKEFVAQPDSIKFALHFAFELYDLIGTFPLFYKPHS